MRCLGLDLSTTASGMVVLAGMRAPGVSIDIVHREVFKPKAPKGVALTPYMKQDQTMTHIADLLDEYRPEAVVVEGYGMNLRNPSAIIPLVELGGIVRFMLKAREQAAYAPTPAVIKKFVTNNGAAKKNTMLMAVFKKWGFEGKDDNEADAYAAARIGLGLNGIGAPLAYEREVLGMISAI